MIGQGVSLESRNHYNKPSGISMSWTVPGAVGEQSPEVITHTSLQSLLHVEERVGNAADFSQDLGVQLLMVLEYLVHVKCQEVLGHAAYV